MNRKKRTEILIQGSADVAPQLAREILATYDLEIVEQSHSGLVMVQIRESAKRGLFYLGEVLITECKVMVNGNLGIGMVIGHEPELALHLAVIDAAYNGQLTEVTGWHDTLLAEEELIKRQHAAFNQQILRTKVNFDAMDV
jgi:phosphonate C-P lyase system protein PhnG